MHNEFTAVFRKVPEGYIGFVEELPGANTQGDTLELAVLPTGEAIVVWRSHRDEIAAWLGWAAGRKS